MNTPTKHLATMAMSMIFTGFILYCLFPNLAMLASFTSFIVVLGTPRRIGDRIFRKINLEGKTILDFTITEVVLSMIIYLGIMSVMNSIVYSGFQLDNVEGYKSLIGLVMINYMFMILWNWIVSYNSYKTVES